LIKELNQLIFLMVNRSVNRSFLSWRTVASWGWCGGHEAGSYSFPTGEIIGAPKLPTNERAGPNFFVIFQEIF